MTQSGLEQLTDRKTLISSSVWSVLSSVVPLAIAIVVVPVLISELGIDRFGLLTVFWIVASATSLFDLGLGVTVTQAIASRLGSGRRDEVSEVFWVATGLVTTLGLVGLVVIILLSNWVVESVLMMPPDLRPEGATAFRLLAVVVPLVTTTASARGALAAYQRFDLIALVRIPLGSFTFLAPVVAVGLFGPSLVGVVGVLVLARLLGLTAYTLLVFANINELRGPPRFKRSLVGPLLRFGGWMTVSNVLTPMLVYVDRFVIAASLGVGLLTYYAAPLEMMVRTLVVPIAVAGVIFPAFATTYQVDPLRTANLYRRSLWVLGTIAVAVSLVSASLAREGLDVWLGPGFAARSTTIVQIVAIGLVFNAVAQAPLALLRAIGRPDLPARLHIVELLAYVPLLIVLVGSFGLNGAAWAWTLRVTVDALVLLALVRRRLGATVALSRSQILGTLAGMAGIAIGVTLDEPWLRGAYLAVSVALLVLVFRRVGIREFQASGRRKTEDGFDG